MLRPWILVLILLVPHLAWAQSKQPPESLLQRVDAVAESQIQKQQLVSLCVGIIQQGKVVGLRAYGFEDRENQLPATKQTMYRWASVSKPLTAIAALQLVEQGKLDLDDDVRKYVPEFPDHGHKITVRNLLCHQSGIVHYQNGKVIPVKREYASPHPFENVVVALDTFGNSPLVHPPGEKFSYSTHAYILLSAVVERAGKQRFADQVKERICEPLGMNTLQPDYQWLDIPHRAAGYFLTKPEGKIKRSSDTDVSWKLGGGGYLSNIEDMTKFALGLMGEQLIQPETKQVMWTRQPLSDGSLTRIGLGIYVVEKNGQVETISHNGAQEKTRTRLVVWPAKQQGIVVMTNSQNADLTRVTRLLAKAIDP